MRRCLAAGAICIAPLVVVPGGVDFAHLPQSLYTQALALGALAWALATARLPWRLNAPDALLSAAACWAALSLAWTPALLTGATLALQGVGCAAAYLLARWGPWPPRALLAGVFAAGVAVAGIGLAQIAGLDWPQRAEFLGATLGNANAASHIVVLALPCALVVPRGAAAAGALVVVGYLLAAGSTTACVAALAQIGAICSLRLERDERHLVLVLALACLAAALPALVVELEPLGGLAQRLAMASNTMPMIADHPFGVGLGGWSVTYPEYAQAVVPDPIYGLDTQPVRTHNDYLQVAAELGWVPVLIFTVGFVIFTVRSRFRPGNHGSRAGNHGSFHGSRLALLGFAVLALGSFPGQLPAASWLAAICLGCALRAPAGLAPGKWVTAGTFTGMAPALGGVCCAVALLATTHHATAIVADHHRRAAQNAARAHDWVQMEREYIEAWRLRPLDGRSLSHAGAALLMQRRDREAVQLLEASLELRPNQIHALSDLAVGLHRAGRRDEARRHMARALDLAPSSRRLLANARRLDVHAGEQPPN